MIKSVDSLCRSDAIADGGATAVEAVIDGESANLIVLRRGDAVYAYHNVCPHAGRRLDYAPGQFLVRGERIICPAHGATFDVATGRCLAGPGGGELKAASVDVIDGVVCIRNHEGEPERINDE